MEVNKDAAEDCIGLAEKCIAEGNFVKAKHYLVKSQKLYPMDKAKDLLDLVENISQSSRPENDEGARKRRPTGSVKEEENSEKKSSSKPSSELEYSKEQLEAVRKIKKCKNYYEILGVTKEATDSDLKKAYKKLALQLHPDKNKCPGAAEAFKAVGNAMSVLMDREKRKLYDLYGGEEERSPTSRQYASREYRGFEADITAEELFNMFFGGGFNNQNVYMRRNGHWQRASATTDSSERSHQTSGYTLFLQMMPILLLIILSMMSSVFVSDPIYSLQQSAKYPVQRKTLNLKVPYYVKENFHTEYQGSLRRLEISVEEEYATNLRYACYREKNYRETMLWKARNFGDRDLYQKAQNIRTPSCDALHDLQAGG